MLAFQTIERRGDLIRTQAFQGQGEEEGCLLRMPGGGGREIWERSLGDSVWNGNSPSSRAEV